MKQRPRQENLAVFLPYCVPCRHSGLTFEQDECAQPNRDEVRKDDLQARSM
jgi:hypothetical protein